MSVELLTDRLALAPSAPPAPPPVESAGPVGRLDSPAECATIQLAAALAPAPAAYDPFPETGDTFEGFEILTELGRGAMGRVFLARQSAPTERVVVLKIGRYLSSECRKLAKLQHPNVVPVYSFHASEDVQAVCMPYRGPLTLAHLVARLRSENLHTLDGKTLTTAINECREHRQPSVALGTSSPAPAGTPADPAAPTNAEQQSPDLFAGLRGLAYVDAVLTIFRQMVEGLRAAHAERIVHCDLKPANVLIADDGTAQLIDFGIAYDKSEIARGQLRLGGTRPYMSPEQLHSIATAELAYDERSDLYAVGVMLYELLTGQLPFGESLPGTDGAVRERELRFAPPPPARELNPGVPPAVAAIIAKCLAPDVADRYQSAAQLLEDLDRQIARRRLRYAPNPSGRELVAKWATRNRVLLAVAGVLLAAGTGLGAFALRDSRQGAKISQLELVAAGEPFAADAEEAEFHFVIGDRDPVYRERAEAAARRALDRFGAGADPEWYLREDFRALDPERASEYRQRAAGIMLLLANARASESTRTADAAKRAELLESAANWNRRAEQAHPAAEGCRAVWAQRGYLARLGGDPVAAERLARRAEALPPSASDAVLEGRQHLTEGRVQQAHKAFKAATAADPKNMWAAFYLGVSYQMLNQPREAVAAYDICLSLRPGFFGAHFNRGQARLRCGQLPEAEEDFERALKGRPDWAAVHFERALGREARKHYSDALDDLNRALELGYTPTSVLLVRSRVYGRMNKSEEAARDFAEAIKTVPTDERGWLARAQAQLFRAPEAALADYEAALKLNPRLAHALQGKAHLLSRAGKNTEAAEVLGKLIEVTPDAPDAWAGRGVLRARLNDRAGALADAREALKLTEAAATKYQVAGIFAMTSRTNPEDRREAFSLLDAALREGFGFEYLKDDKELDPIRNDPEFQKVVDAAKAYRQALKKVD